MFEGEVVAEADGFTVNGQRVKLLSDPDPSALPWGEWTSTLWWSPPASSGNGKGRN